MITTAHAGGALSERVRFFPRQLVDADDLNQEQAYHRNRLREHNRLLHGWGVVCGCDVQPVATTEQPWLVRVCPGFLLTPQGDAVRIDAAADFDVATCLLRSEDPCAYARPCPPVTRRALESDVVYLAVRAIECESRPVRVSAVGCGCDETDCEYSRVRDGYELCCLAELPPTHGATEPDLEAILSGDPIAPCAPCPSDPWVVLATITLPASRGAELVTVDPLADRRRLLSTAALQEAVRAVAARLP